LRTETFLDIALDPNHILAELLWNLVFDGLVVAFLYGFIVKKVIIPRLRRDIHREIDNEHGIDHSQHGDRTGESR
jgi:p-aminobenzoyl-glutamate transporter AbgT